MGVIITFYFFGVKILISNLYLMSTVLLYICSYMMKSEKALGEVLKSVAKECCSNPIEQELKKIGKTFIGNRIFGSPEAAM